MAAALKLDARKTFAILEIQQTFNIKLSVLIFLFDQILFENWMRICKFKHFYRSFFYPNDRMWSEAALHMYKVETRSKTDLIRISLRWIVETRGKQINVMHKNEMQAR